MKEKVFTMLTTNLNMKTQKLELNKYITYSFK